LNWLKNRAVILEFQFPKNRASEVNRSFNSELWTRFRFALQVTYRSNETYRKKKLMDYRHTTARLDIMYAYYVYSMFRINPTFWSSNSTIWNVEEKKNQINNNFKAEKWTELNHHETINQLDSLKRKMNCCWKFVVISD